MLTHTQARMIAEGCWGRGGTNSERTTRIGRVLFLLPRPRRLRYRRSGITDEELVAISPYINLEDAEVFKWGRRTLFHPYRRKGGRYSMAAKRQVH